MVSWFKMMKMYMTISAIDLLLEKIIPSAVKIFQSRLKAFPFYREALEKSLTEISNKYQLDTGVDWLDAKTVYDFGGWYDHKSQEEKDQFWTDVFSELENLEIPSVYADWFVNMLFLNSETLTDYYKRLNEKHGIHEWNYDPLYFYWILTEVSPDVYQKIPITTEQKELLKSEYKKIKARSKDHLWPDITKQLGSFKKSKIRKLQNPKKIKRVLEGEGLDPETNKLFWLTSDERKIRERAKKKMKQFWR